MSSKSRLWTLAMAVAASMGRPASAQQIRQLESEIQELAGRYTSEADPLRKAPAGGPPTPVPGALPRP